MANPIDYSKLDEQLASMLNPRDPAASPLTSAPRIIREAASHDFSEYRFLSIPITTSDSTYSGWIPTEPEAQANLGLQGTGTRDLDLGLSGSSGLDADMFGSAFDVESSSGGGTGAGVPSGSGGVGTGTPSGSETMGAFIEHFRDVIRGVLEEKLARMQVYEYNAAGAYTIQGSDFVQRRESSFNNLTDYITFSGFVPDMGYSLYILYTVELGEPDWFLLNAGTQVRVFFQRLFDWQVGYDVFDPVSHPLGDRDLWSAGVIDVTDALRMTALQRSTSEPSVDGGTPGTTQQGWLPEKYGFTPYEPDSVNLGLQIVYRQRWVPLGTQQGEILRTIPLGPKQTEKVTVKAIRRTKSTRQSEIVTSIETATESSAATKDSQEVIQEASEKFNWHVNASGDSSFGFGSASVEAGMGGETASSSKDSKSTLTENMQKSASKINRTEKIVVSTEREETKEFLAESVITNANDEIAVTYVYSRLQRQYEIHTYLSEVNSCIFIAEKMPSPGEIDGAWIRQHDWIIAQVLLDESFRADLEIIRAHDPHEPTEDMDTEIRSLMQKYSQSDKGLPDYTQATGSTTLTLPDMYSTPQNAYEREVERKRARTKDRQAYDRAERRMCFHIFDNILHYMRAIWSSVDIAARLMLYQQRKIPTWQFTATDTDEDSDGNGNLVGTWAATGDRVPLADLINPAGPIGYAGNYAVFYLKQDGRFPEQEAVVDQLRLPYLRHRGVGKYLGTRDAAFQITVLVSPNQRDKVRYTMSWIDEDEDGEGHMQIECDVIDWEDTLIPQPVADGDIHLENNIFQFDNLKVKITPFESLRNGDRFEINVYVDPILEDPELRQIRYTETPMDLAQEPGFYTIEVLAEHAEFFPEIEQALIEAETRRQTALSNAAVRPPVALDDETRELMRRLGVGEISLADLDEVDRNLLRNVFTSSAVLDDNTREHLRRLAAGEVSLADLDENTRNLLRNLFRSLDALDDQTRELLRRLAAGEVSLVDLNEETRSSLRHLFRLPEAIEPDVVNLLSDLADGTITLAGLRDDQRERLHELFAPLSPWEQLDDATQQLIRDRLAEYILRKRHTRQLVLDTNNVLLSLMVDNNSIIEPFKQLHRYIDVLSALSDMESKRLENRRREARIDAGRLGDPEVEKVTVVAPADRLGDFAALDAITPDGEATPASSTGSSGGAG